ncbi:MAG TPA: YvcK family protein [Thermoflexales bacterium]|nr:YvcK family protein [Thermoflexales bacterium]HQW35971.1 YvcK family protein [Thermoflexales bacterium]HQZ23607.1 YvcK family protein [Thermoflexales bacterium]HQZ99854.1 YvcK family protein [Thermoflexales bacterium]
MFSAVSIGGGCGAVQVLLGLRKHTANLTGIIAVTDTGRSTGKVRSLANIPAPGDVRNALGTLAGDDTTFAKLIQHRMLVPKSEQLNGVAFGNLMLAALTQMSGDFGEAVNAMRQMLGVDIRILPVTTHNTHICAELVDGTMIAEELNVRALGKPDIKRVFIQDRMARAYAPCVDALLGADLITIGPGSLFTTVLACLAFDEVSQAIQKSPAKTVYVCNNTTQPGQTDGFTLADHVDQVKTYLNGRLDYVLLNTRAPSDALRMAYQRDGVEVLLPTDDEVKRIEKMGPKVIVRDLAQLTEGKRDLFDKQDSIRHDPDTLGAALMEILNEEV